MNTNKLREAVVDALEAIDMDGLDLAYVLVKFDNASTAIEASPAAEPMLMALRIHHKWSLRNMPGYSEHGDERVAYRATIAALNGNGGD